MIAAFTTSLLLFAAPHSASAADPTCNPMTVVTRPLTPITFPADMNCTDVGVAPTIDIVTAPFGGTLSGSPLVYSPANGFAGTDHFFYTVKNNQTGLTSAVTAVNIVVNTLPTCGGGTASTPPDTPVRIPFSAFNCSDADGQSVIIHSSDPAHGTAEDDFGSLVVVYTPAPGFTGTDTFEYHGSDGVQQSAARTMTVTVAATPAATPTPPATPVTPGSTAPPPPAKDTTAPTASLKADTASLAKGIALTLTSSEAGTAKLTATVDKATARKLKLDRKAKGPVSVGTGTATLTGGKPATLTLKLTSRARSAFKRAKKVKLLLTAVFSDAAGNRATKTLAVTLKR